MISWNKLTYPVCFNKRLLLFLSTEAHPNTFGFSGNSHLIYKGKLSKFFKVDLTKLALKFGNRICHVYVEKRENSRWIIKNVLSQVQLCVHLGKCCFFTNKNTLNVFRYIYIDSRLCIGRYILFYLSLITKHLMGKRGLYQWRMQRGYKAFKAYNYKCIWKYNWT